MTQVAQEMPEAGFVKAAEKDRCSAEKVENGSDENKRK